MKNINKIIILANLILLITSCISSGPVVREITINDSRIEAIDKKYINKLEEIKKNKDDNSSDLNKVIESTPNLNVSEYLKLHPAKFIREKYDYKVGGYDVLSITVYEEPDLSKDQVRVAADGYISFPLIGRIKVEDLTTSEIEGLISLKLAEGQFLYDAHVSVIVKEYRSKQFFVLGSVNAPGVYSLKARERILDAVSRAKGIDFEQCGKKAMIVRTEHSNTDFERKIVIKIDLQALLKGSDQISNILLLDRDVLYISKPDYFYIIGQVKKPGSYPYLQKDITLVEAISMAEGFTRIAARNKTRIIRVENGIEKIIEVKVDAITNSGKKAQDVMIRPEDVIVVPESFF